MADDPPIEIRGLVKRYGQIAAVDGVDLTVNRGDVFGYLGPNGAGKTTSLRMMLGLIRPSAGSVRLFGGDPQVSVKALRGVKAHRREPASEPAVSCLHGAIALRQEPRPLLVGERTNTNGSRKFKQLLEAEEIGRAHV